MIFDAIGDVSLLLLSSELGITRGELEGRRLLVGKGKGVWIVSECERAVLRVNRGAAVLSRMK